MFCGCSRFRFGVRAIYGTAVFIVNYSGYIEYVDEVETKNSLVSGAHGSWAPAITKTIFVNKYLPYLRTWKNTSEESAKPDGVGVGFTVPTLY